MKARKSNGAILYRGPSLIDGKPIIVIAIGLTRGSANSKTGNMLQTYILRSDMSPLRAINAGADASICGTCPHRGRIVKRRNTGRTCYVNIGQGVTVVYKAFRRNRYPMATAEQIAAMGSGRMVRLGTYGDPAAAPVALWQSLTSQALGHTGYTHQWRTSDALRGLVMASADSVQDATDAHAKAWRTFRVALPGDLPKLTREVSCPASAEAGRKLTCAQCKACTGADGRKSSIVIRAHGGFAVMANIKKRSELFPVNA